VSPDIRRLMGANPRFESDIDFLPLQAGDLFAWWIRRWESAGRFDKPDFRFEFPWKLTANIPYVHIRYREQELREELETVLSQRASFLSRQSRETLQLIDEGRLYDLESHDKATISPLRRLLRWCGFLGSGDGDLRG